MKKFKTFIFIGIITLIMSIILLAPKTKALTLYDDYNAMVVYWDDSESLMLTYFEENLTYTITLSIYDIVDVDTNDPLLLGYEFQNGIKLYITSIEAGLYKGRLVEEELEDFKIYPQELMVEFQIYEYKGIYENHYLFQQGLTFYKVETEGVNFKNNISGEIEFITTLKPGNQYVYWKTLNEFHFVDSYDYAYTLGFYRGAEAGQQSAYEAYRDGYEAGSKLAEGLLQSEYLRGYNNGNNEGYTKGYNEGYLIGFNNAYNEIVESDEYQLGYNNGFKDGEKSKLSKNTELFYGGIEKWLVPAVITVIVLGGIVSIAAFKRREQ